MSAPTPQDPSEGRSLAFEGRGGVRLVSEAWGDPAAPPVLLLHGGGQTRHAWRGTARALAGAGWYAIALDARGHGDSDWCDDGNYGADDFVADLRAVIARLEQPPVLVGASLGGITSLLAVAEADAPIATALVLVDIAPRMERKGMGRILDFMRAKPDGFESLEEVADAIAAYMPHRERPRDLSGLEKNLRRHADGRWRWHWDPQFIDAERPPLVRRPDRLEQAARSLTLPTLLVRGRLSDLLSEEGAREFLEQVPHARFVDVSGAGHMVAGDRNDVFTKAVADFLADVLEGRAETRSVG